MKILLSISLVVAAAAVTVDAQPQSAAPDASQKVVPGPNGSNTLRLDGIDIEFDPNGNWNKIYSTYTQPVDVPDRRGIKKAQVIAEEKGKAQIVRFLQQEVSSDRLVEEVDTTLQTATHKQGPGSKDEISKTTQRTMKESVREFTRSFAKGTLRGVTVIEVGYNSNAEEAWVKVGFSRSTMAISDNVQKSIQAPGSVGSDDAKNGSGVKKQPGEVRDGRVIH